METVKKKRKLKKMDCNTNAWEKLANNLARSWVQIVPCRHCGRPVINGYCCSFCDSDTP
jgi:hypothetical protein